MQSTEADVRDGMQENVGERGMCVKMNNAVSYSSNGEGAKSHHRPVITYQITVSRHTIVYNSDVPSMA